MFFTKGIFFLVKSFFNKYQNQQQENIILDCHWQVIGFHKKQ